jgi:hypothetical protein
MLIHQDDESWRAEEDAAFRWSFIEDDALEIPSRAYPYAPISGIRLPAVVFIPTKDGKRRTKPFDSNTDSPGPNSQERSG